MPPGWVLGERGPHSVHSRLWVSTGCVQIHRQIEALTFSDSLLPGTPPTLSHPLGLLFPAPLSTQRGSSRGFRGLQPPPQPHLSARRAGFRVDQERTKRLKRKRRFTACTRLPEAWSLCPPRSSSIRWPGHPQVEVKRLKNSRTRSDGPLHQTLTSSPPTCCSPFSPWVVALCFSSEIAVLRELGASKCLLNKR